MLSKKSIKEIVKSISGRSFSCRLYADTGGCCGDGWVSEDEDIDLTAKELRYLICNRVGRREYFDEKGMKEIDVEEALSNLSREVGEPDGGPVATVHSPIPQELEELAEEIDNFDDYDDDDALEEIRNKIREIGDGQYTFTFTVEDGTGCYEFDEYAEEKIALTAEQARGLLYGDCQDDDIFEGLCDKMYDEDLINDLAEKAGFADDYDTFTFDGDSEELDMYLNSWNTFFNRIMDGTVNANNLSDWLEYFNEGDYEKDIDEWYEENYAAEYVIDSTYKFEIISNTKNQKSLGFVSIPVKLSEECAQKMGEFFNEKKPYTMDEDNDFGIKALLKEEFQCMAERDAQCTLNKKRKLSIIWDDNLKADCINYCLENDYIFIDEDDDDEE